MLSGNSVPTYTSHKRRRLATPPPPLSSDHDLSNPPTPIKLSFLSPTEESKAKLAVIGGPKNPIATIVCCTSCRRVLHATRTGIVECARCNTLSCLICSRRCTRRIPSYPPTPQLSFTPTPTPSPTFPFRRLVLHAANTANTLCANLTANSDDTPRKRKKATENQDHDDARCAAKGIVRKSLQENSPSAGAEGDMTVDSDEGGCGRTFCKGCCYEDGDAVTCFSCNGTR